MAHYRLLPPAYRLSSLSYLRTMRFRLLILLVFCASATLSAQKTFSAGVVAGINGCQIHGDSYSGFDQIGFVAGAFVHNNPGETWQAQFGIQYTRKGARHVVRPELGGYRDFEIRLNYIEVPLVIRYNTKKVFFDLGLATAVLFSVREWDAAGSITPRDFKKMEFAFTAGIGFNINEAMFIEFSGTSSIVPIKNFSVPMYYQRWLSNLFNRGMYNNIVGLTFGYRFGTGSNE